MNVPNRLKFALGGDVLETVNPWIPGAPHAELVRLVGSYRPAKVLELCTGTGYVARHLAEAVPGVEVHGLDISPEMLAVGRRKLAHSSAVVTLVEGDAAALPYPDESFDVVMAAFGLHELPPAVRRAAIAESVRVLRPDGRLIAMDIDRPAGFLGPVVDGYLAIFEPSGAGEVCGSGLAQLFAGAGLTVTHHRAAGTRELTQTIVAGK